MASQEKESSEVVAPGGRLGRAVRAVKGLVADRRKRFFLIVAGMATVGLGTLALRSS